jgi:purine-nucleoside phosphorylase
MGTSISPAFGTLTEAVRTDPALVAMVLGSGMSFVAERWRRLHSVPFGDIPGLTATSVAGHKGCLTLGTWAGRRILIFEGRLHYYEGHAWENVVAPVRTAAALGVRILLLTNAAGGIHDALGAGSLMAIRDHIEWTRPYCWRQPGPGGLGGARPTPYSARLLTILTQAAQDIGTPLYQGVYAALTGPCYETPAEIRALRTWGADAVGMSTTREIQTGFDLGLECAAVSCITNKAAGLSATPLNHEEVLATAAAQSERLGNLLERFLTLVNSP